MKRITRRVMAALGTVVLVFGAAVSIHNLIADRAMVRDVMRVDRDPATNVARGTEAITLEGSGPDALLMVHGFAGSRIELGTGAETFRDLGLTVRQMRLPGHGTFPIDHATTSAEDLLEAVRAEIRDLRSRHDRVTVLAFSMGASIAAILAAEENPDALILVSPYFRVTHQWYYVLPVEAWTPLLSWCLPYVIKSEDFVQLNREEARPLIFTYNLISTRATLTAMDLAARARDEATLSRIQCPVLVLQSRGDQAASPKATERVFPLIGSADKRLVWYEDSNHILLWDYDREDAQREIAEFLRRQHAR